MVRRGCRHGALGPSAAGMERSCAHGRGRSEISHGCAQNLSMRASFALCQLPSGPRAGAGGRGQRQVSVSCHWEEITVQYCTVSSLTRYETECELWERTARARENGVGARSVVPHGCAAAPRAREVSAGRLPDGGARVGRSRFPGDSEARLLGAAAPVAATGACGRGQCNAACCGHVRGRRREPRLLLAAVCAARCAAIIHAALFLRPPSLTSKYAFLLLRQGTRSSPWSPCCSTARRSRRRSA